MYCFIAYIGRLYPKQIIQNPLFMITIRVSIEEGMMSEEKWYYELNTCIPYHNR